MKKLLRSFAVVAAVATFVLFARPANSEEALGALGPSVGSSGASGSTTIGTTIGLLPLATTGAIIYFVVIKKDDKGTAPTTVEDAGGGYVMNETEAEKWVELYVRDHSEQLTADIARGYGPTLTDLSVMLHIKAEHRAQFGARLQANASELLPLTNKNTLTQKRAAQFFERMGDILRADAALKRDLSSIRI